MQSKYIFSTVDKVLRDLCDRSGLFGSIPVLLGGDFAQILPVVQRGRREQVVNASIKLCPGWCSIKPLFLTQNMRVTSEPDNQRFAGWLSALPYVPSMYGSIEIPKWIRTTDDRTLFRGFVYPIRDLQSLETSIFHDRAILSSRNDATHRFDDEVGALCGTSSRDYFSLDEVRNEDGVLCDYTPEYLRQVTCQGLPPGILRLQVGMPVMLLRNYYTKLGLCNGTRLIITRFYSRCVKRRIVSQEPRFHGKEHLISRFTMNSDDDLPFLMVRRQLPPRPCFAMTINKSQGQTIKVVGVDLSTPVFTHGQFYVALSRVTDVKKYHYSFIAPYKGNS